MTHDFVIEHGGGSLLDKYGGSLPTMLSTVYPNFIWHDWRFPRRTGKIKPSLELTKEIISYVETALGFSTPSDWYRLTGEQLASLGLGVSLKKNEKLLKALKTKYPSENWNDGLFLATN